MAGNLPLYFREYRATDRDACIEAFSSNVPQYFFPSELAQFKDWLTKHEALAVDVESVGRYFVVMLNNSIIGCGGFALDKSINEARMTWGLIDEKFHRKGIGKEFLLWRINQIRATAPGYSIALDTTQHSAPFFEKMGFEVVKVTNDAYGPGMHRYDMVQKLSASANE